MASPAADAQGEEALGEDESGTSVDDTYQHEQPVYFPEELVDNWLSFSRLGLYYSYKISVRGCFSTTTAPTDIILAVRCDLGPEFLCYSFNMGGVQVSIEYAGIMHLNQEQIIYARRFQTTILSLLINKDHSEVSDVIKDFHELHVSLGVVYLLLPSVYGQVDWCNIKFAASPEYDKATDKHIRHCHACKDAHLLQTEDCRFCTCMLQNCVVYTPHTKMLHIVTGFLDLNANSPMRHMPSNSKDGTAVSYTEYFKAKYRLHLSHETQRLFSASGLFSVQNCLHKGYKRGKVFASEPSNGKGVELPPELCRVVIAPVSANTLRVFTFVPSIMYRIQCMLLSVNLKIQLGPRMQQFNIKAPKIMEALTTEECQEEFSQESLETLGDSFLKYVTSRHLFIKYKHLQEDMLTSKRKELVNNTVLCQLACIRNLVGYIRGEEFKLKDWIIPGLGYDKCGNSRLSFIGTNNMYILKKISIISGRIADTVEALIAACLSLGGESGEQAASQFIKCLGIDIELHSGIQDERKVTTKSEINVEFINARCSELETMLGYVFNDRSLLVEALTHGSYKPIGTTACNQRLEFLGDAILDYIITEYFFKRYYPACTPELLTDLRKASVNNHCFAHASVKNGLHKHFLYYDEQMKKVINDLVNSERSFSGPSYGSEPGTGIPKYLADLIESIAGAIYLDSKFDKEKVWRVMKRLLEPLATAENLQRNIDDPVTELKQFCEHKKYPTPSYTTTRKDGVTTVVAKVRVAGTLKSGTGTGTGRGKDVRKSAAKALLRKLKATGVP